VLVLAIVAAAAPVLAARTSVRPSDVGRADVDRFVSRYLRHTGLPGAAVAIVHKGRVERAAGYGRGGAGRPVTADSPMPIASLSKSMTALAVLQLVDAGRVDLDTPARAYLPEFHTADPRGDRITVRHLLAHMSGLADTTYNPMDARPRSLREAVALLRTARLAGDPGTRWRYHNPNYQVAARLVEVVSGEPFNDYLRRHVFEPLGMTGTHGSDDPRGISGSVPAYGLSIRLPEPDWFIAGAGGVVSTAADLARWLLLHTSGAPPVVSARALALAHAPAAPSGRYGLGWSVSDPAAGPVRIGHTGALFTTTAYQVVVPATGWGVAVLAARGMSLAGNDAESLGRALLALVTGGRPRIPARVPPVDLGTGALTVLVLVLGIAGLRHAGGWARRRAGRPLWTVALRLVPLVAVAAVPTFLPSVALWGSGRAVTLTQLAYLAPAVLLGCGVAATVAAAVAAARGAGHAGTAPGSLTGVVPSAGGLRPARAGSSPRLARPDADGQRGQARTDGDRRHRQQVQAHRDGDEAGQHQHG
jgi:CubicO group peptidase (beta-lactamase class C family)